MKKKLTKSQDKKIAGIAAGIAEYFNIDTTLVRLIFIFLTIFTGIIPCIAFYIIAALVVPEFSVAEAQSSEANHPPKGPESGTVEQVLESRDSNNIV
jgi:phage shock protein C